MDKKEMLEVLLHTPITVEKDKAYKFFKAMNYAIECLQKEGEDDAV